MVLEHAERYALCPGHRGGGLSIKSPSPKGAGDGLSYSEAKIS